MINLTVTQNGPVGILLLLLCCQLLRITMVKWMAVYIKKLRYFPYAKD